MSIVKRAPKLPSATPDTRPVDYNRAIVQLGLKKAELERDYEIKLREVNELDQKRTNIEEKIKKEQAIYDSMVLKPHAELKADLEEKISGHKVILIDLLANLDEIRGVIARDKQIIVDLTWKIEDLKKQIVDNEEKLKTAILKANEELVIIRNQIKNAVIELQLLLTKSEQAKKDFTIADQDTKNAIQKQKDYEAFLERKTRDLQIWEQRLSPLFKEKYPNGEMKFV